MAHTAGSGYNLLVKGFQERRLVLILAAGMLFLISLPYLLALLLTPADFVFSGFLINPLDGFSYLAKMNQGRLGSWLFKLPYAAAPGKPTLLFTFYLALGQLGRVLNIANPILFHLTRLAAAGAMAAAAFGFIRRVTQTEQTTRWSIFIFLFASGFGWLAAPFGWLTSDLAIPESIPLFGASLNPHFPLAYAALALAGLLLLAPQFRWRNVLISCGLGLVIGAVQPFAGFSFALIGLVWLLWETFLTGDGLRGIFHIPGLPVAAGFALGAGPWLLYDFWLTQSHPVLQAWNAQNLTPSPPPWSYLVGFGLPLLLAIVGLITRRRQLTPAWRLVVTWLVVNALLLYVPFNWQRRLVLGMFLPLAAAAGVGLQWLTSSFQRRRWLPYLLVGLALPSNLIALAAGVGLVADGSNLLLFSPGERAGYQWIAENIKEDALVLAAPVTGNRLPAFAPVRVLYGHPFETPEAGRNKELVSELLELVEKSPEAASELSEFGIGYVVLGSHERDFLGRPVKVPAGWPTLFSEGEFKLLAVPSP